MTDLRSPLARAGVTRSTAGFAALLLTVPARVLVDPVRAGRLRDFSWPYGLRAVVVLAGCAYALAGAVVAFSGPLRAGSDLTVPSTGTVTVPRTWLWVVLLVVLVALALFQTAALHTPWWLRLVALLTSLLIMAVWGLRYSATSGGLLESLLTVLAMAALVGLVIARWRRAFAWWEFGVVLLLLTSAVVLGIVVLERTARPLGYDFVPVYLQTTITSLGPLAMPAAVAAGLSVAEITVSATLWGTRLTTRAATARLTYLVLAGLLGLRLTQAGWQLATWDFVRSDGRMFATWALFAGLLAGLSAVMIRLAGGTAQLTVPALPDRMAAMALPLGLLTVFLGFFSVLAVGVFGVVAQLAPQRVGATSGAWLSYLTSSVGPAVFRLVVGLGLVAAAVRSARRGRAVTSLLLSAVAVMLWARGARSLTGGWLDPGSSSDALNLLATAVLVAVLAGLLLRRRLTPRRAAALSGAVMLTFLLGYRDFVSDPLGAVLGFSGAALVLFGLTWSLLTDSGPANEGSPKYPVAARVLLVLANSVLAVAVLAYTSLVRDPSATIDLGDFAKLGDQTLGTALLAATLIAALAAVREDRAID